MMADLRMLPLAYRCAFEMLTTCGERSQARLQSLFEHFERAYGIGASEERDMHRAQIIDAARMLHDWRG